jgi:hypothetical protein
VKFETTGLKRRPDLEDQVHRLAEEGWSTFLLDGDMTHWERLFDEFADYQIFSTNRQEAWSRSGTPFPSGTAPLTTCRTAWRISQTAR